MDGGEVVAEIVWHIAADKDGVTAELGAIGVIVRFDRAMQVAQAV